MIYKDGQYLHVCGFILCGRDFYGRSNKVYCSQKCKQAHNGRKTSLVIKAANGADLKIKKAVRIILDLFEADREGKFVIHQVQLASLAFPFDLPTVKIKDDRYNGTLFGFGSFCFYQKDGYFVFYKI
jgi:hypothetical protein